LIYTLILEKSIIISLYVFIHIDSSLIIKTILILMYAVHSYLFSHIMILSKKRLFKNNSAY